MLNLNRTKLPSNQENIRLKLIEYIIDECNKNYEKARTLINSKRQTYIAPIVKSSSKTVISSKSNLSKTSSNDALILDEKKHKFEKAMNSYKYLQYLSGKGNKVDSCYSPCKIKKKSLKANPIEESMLKSQTDRALQTVNFDNLKNIIIEKTTKYSKNKTMTKKELKIDTEIEISEFHKMLHSPSEFNIVKTTMSNLSNYSNDFTIKMNRCVTTSSNSSYSSHYMLTEDCHRYYDNDDTTDYYSRLGEFQIKLKSCIRRNRTLSQITPTSSDLELS